MSSEEQPNKSDWQVAILYALGVDYFNPTSEENGVLRWDSAAEPWREDKISIQEIMLSPNGKAFVWMLSFKRKNNRNVTQIILKKMKEGGYEITFSTFPLKLCASTIEELIGKIEASWKESGQTRLQTLLLVMQKAQCLVAEVAA